MPSKRHQGPNIPEFLASEGEKAADDIQGQFLQFEDLWERKLWHELTDLLTEFFELPESRPHQLPLWKNFISTFADKINKLKLVTLGLHAAEQLGADRNVCLEFVQKILPKVEASKDAKVFVLVNIADNLLQLNRFEDARTRLDECEKILEDIDSVETIVHASFYVVNAIYYQRQLDFAAYYKNALLYLACVKLDALTPKERQFRAYDLSIAALVSEHIYNFGELLLHPILDSLKDGDNAWLRELLFAFNRGDLKAYEMLDASLEKNELLKQHYDFLVQKIGLAALTETVFRRPPHERALTFATLAKETKLKKPEVEYLVMKALSLGLIKGQIDQVAEVARINWVQPKVLDMKQIEGMRGRLKEWDSNVNQLGNWIEGVGKDVWAA